MGLWEIIPAPQISGSSFSRVDDNSSVSSATSATSLPSPDSCKNSDTNYWIKSQIDILVSLWQENIRALELARSHKIWVKIKATVDNLAPAKTIRQCKDKMWNLKDACERAKESNKKIGAAWRFRPCLLKLTKFLDVEMLRIYQKKQKLVQTPFPTTKLTPAVTRIQRLINPMF